MLISWKLASGMLMEAKKKYIKLINRKQLLFGGDKIGRPLLSPVHNRAIINVPKYRNLTKIISLIEIIVFLKQGKQIDTTTAIQFFFLFCMKVKIQFLLFLSTFYRILLR